MATIVEHTESRTRYVLLGSGFGMYRAKVPGILFGNLVPNTEEGSEKLLCVMQVDGEIHWLRTAEVKVISIDGKSPDQLFHS